jgi:hypothetical protein
MADRAGIVARSGVSGKSGERFERFDWNVIRWGERDG